MWINIYFQTFDSNRRMYSVEREYKIAGWFLFFNFSLGCLYNAF